MSSDPGSKPPGATVGVYDRPPWWRSRRTLRLIVPVAAALLSLVSLYFFLR